MKSAIYKHIETLLIEYPKIDKEIQQARQELSYKHVERDDNVGGGKGNKTSRAVEALAIRLADNNHLKMLQLYQSVISDELEHSGEHTKQLINLCYFNKERLTVDTVAIRGIIPESLQELREKRRGFITHVARSLGWIM